MNYPATDPSEWVGTEEYEELRAQREATRQQLLDLIAEQEDEEFIQYPQRFSH